MKRLIAMVAVSVLVGVWTARAENEVKTLAGKCCCEKCLQISDKAGKCPKCGEEMKVVPAKAVDAPK